MKYIPVTNNELSELLKEVNLSSTDDLFRSIPESVQLKTSERLSAPKSEIELRNFFQNVPDTKIKHSFLGGAGHYHYIPSVIDPLISRGEFLTAYTPYQPEVSQGTLQAVFEYQSMMANIMGVEVSNASLYDGSTAMAEACLMAARVNKRYHMLVSESIHPEYIETLDTYSRGEVFKYSTIRSDEKGRTDISHLSEVIREKGTDISALVIQSPNYFGVLENIKNLKDLILEHKILLIVVVSEAMSMGLLKSPGSEGADIVCGEAQSFGIPLSFGGPWLGFIGTGGPNIRNLPGRLIGETVDKENRRAYVVTLAAREQHIRREKATSNICTNQGLMALRSAIYLSVMGKKGLRRAAERCARFAEYGKNRITKISGYTLPYGDSPIFNEFVIETTKPAEEIFHHCVEEAGIAPGTIIGQNRLLASFNETMNPEIIESWVNALERAAH